MAWIRGTLAALVALARRAPQSPLALPASDELLAADGADDATREAVVSAWRAFGSVPVRVGEPTAADVALDLYEAVLARTMHAKVARRVIDPMLRAAIDVMATDAGRRAAQLTRVLERLLEDGGAAARRAARLALQMGSSARRQLPTVAIEGGWERWGIAGRCLEELAAERAVAAVERQIGYGFGGGAPGPSLAASPSASWRKISS